MDGFDLLCSGRVVVVLLWLLCDSAVAVGGRRVVACCVSGALVPCWCLHSHCLVLRPTIQVNVYLFNESKFDVAYKHFDTFLSCVPVCS